MLFSEMTQEEKDQFFKEQEEKVEILRRKRPWINMDKVMSQEDVLRIKEEKKRKNKELYWGYHKKPMNSPDRRKKLWD